LRVWLFSPHFENKGRGYVEENNHNQASDRVVSRYGQFCIMKAEKSLAKACREEFNATIAEENGSCHLDRRLIVHRCFFRA
jgi:hypothetical protein